MKPSVGHSAGGFDFAGSDPMPFRYLIRRLQALRVKAYERNDRVAIATLDAAIGVYRRV
jgi:hypothetical protein